MQQTPQAAYAAPAPPRQPTYETYQAAPQAQTQYTYAARTQVIHLYLLWGIVQLIFKYGLLFMMTSMPKAWFMNIDGGEFKDN